MDHTCFISYASEDLRFAEELYRRLVEEGFAVWFDKACLDSGCDWHREVEKACEASTIAIPVRSRKASRATQTKVTHSCSHCNG